jgi:ligand-binding sensor domain-containing protein
VGTHGGGLAKLDRDRWTVFDSSSGLPDDNVYCIERIDAECDTRGLWLGTENGLARLDRGEWTVSDRSSGLPDNIVWCLLQTETAGGGRALWAGTFGGLAKFERGAWTTVDTEQLPCRLVMCLLEVERPGAVPDREI